VASRVPSKTASGPHVVVVANHKGGCGKTTVTVHIIVALLKEGRRVASFDLDLEQQTLTRYLENRWELGRLHSVPLEFPAHYAAAELTGNDGKADPRTIFTAALARLTDRCDFIVIDTPCGSSDLALLAHGAADTLVTPINDSFVDLDVIGTIGPSSEMGPRRSRYMETVAKAIELRSYIGREPTDWVVVRNRTPTLYSRNENQVTKLLARMATEIGFRVARGLHERTIYRELFPFGLTAFDPLDEALLQFRISRAHLTARKEVRELVTTLGLVPPRKESPEDEDRLQRALGDIRLPRAVGLAEVAGGLGRANGRA
jgi:chromosome partitioning protein